MAAIFTAFAARGAQGTGYVIFDNDFYGPASTNLQAAALLLNSEAKTLGLTVVTGDGWRDEEVAHTLRLLEILGPDRSAGGAGSSLSFSEYQS